MSCGHRANQSVLPFCVHWQTVRVAWSEVYRRLSGFDGIDTSMATLGSDRRICLSSLGFFHPSLTTRWNQNPWWDGTGPRAPR